MVLAHEKTFMHAEKRFNGQQFFHIRHRQRNIFVANRAYAINMAVVVSNFYVNYFTRVQEFISLSVWNTNNIVFGGGVQRWQFAGRAKMHQLYKYGFALSLPPLCLKPVIICVRPGIPLVCSYTFF